MTDAVPHPSATVVLLAEAVGGFRVLMLQRNAELRFHGGAWVFPGGRIDPEDVRLAGGSDPVEAARHAAVRETREEAGLDVPPGELVPFAEWLTPEGRPKRFLTWFFAARAPSSEVTVDGGEVVAHRWVEPAAALELHREGRIELPPPTFVTLTHLALHPSAADAVTALASAGIQRFHPRPRPIDGGLCALYQGDAAYEERPLDTPGPRHRLVMRGTDFRYQRE